MSCPSSWSMKSDSIDNKSDPRAIKYHLGTRQAIEFRLQTAHILSIVGVHFQTSPNVITSYSVATKHDETNSELPVSVSALALKIFPSHFHWVVTVSSTCQRRWVGWCIEILHKNMQPDPGYSLTEAGGAERMQINTQIHVNYPIVNDSYYPNLLWWNWPNESH